MFHLAGTVLNKTRLGKYIIFIKHSTVLKPQQSVSSHQIVRWLLNNQKYIVICDKNNMLGINNT